MGALSAVERRLFVIGCLTLILIGRALPAAAQSCAPLPDNLRIPIQGAAADHVQKQTTNSEQYFRDFATLATLHALGTGPVKDTLYFAGETAETNKQTSAPARTGGIAGLVQKPSFPALLAFAIGSGAVQANRSDTQLTLSSSLYALSAALRGDTAANYMSSGFLTRVGLAATFDATPNAPDPLASVRRDQLRDWSINIRLSPDRTVRSRNFELWWANNVRHVLVEHNKLINRMNQLLEDVEAYSKAFSAAQSVIDAQLPILSKDKEKTAEIERLISCTLRDKIMAPIASGEIALPAETVEELRKKLVPALDEASAQMKTLPDRIREHLKDAEGKPTASFSFTSYRPVDGHDFMEAIVSYTQNVAPLKAILNAGASRFIQRPGLTNQPEGWRDFVVAGALEHSTRGPFIHDDTDLSRMTISIGARYERTFDHSTIVPAAVEKTKKLVQARLEMPVTLGVILPVSFTVSSDEAEVNEARKWEKGMFFGLTFDMDKFAALAKALALQRLR